MNTNLLIEIFSEELPAIPFLKEESYILEKWKKVLKDYELEADFEFFYTPRRLVLISYNFPLKQANKEIEFFGPPLEIAYIDGDKNQGLSKAGESFLKKCEITEAQSRQKDGKEVLYFCKTMEGKESKELLGEMIGEWLKSLHFGKSMRWGNLQDSFIRPIRNIVALLDEKALDFELYGIQSSSSTFVHRDCGFQKEHFSSIQEYLKLLENKGVILDPKVRREKILQGIKEIEKSYGVEVELDKDLLNEVVAITEYPRAVYGRFEEEFLELPKEVIITSMKENQRYFALYQNGKLHNGFIVVINSMSEDTKLIIEGNQKVLRARLSDAMFFYRNDLKKPLASYDLSKIAFVEGLGSMQDKVQREKQIASYLLRDQNKEDVLEALSIAKSDLLSEMVGEFPELQGIMGEYYALNEAKNHIPYRNASIAKAIKEQYFPNGEDALLPSETCSAYVALSFRLDSLLALFSVGKIPSGSKDPYALRRAGNAILKILQAYPIALNKQDLLELAKFYQSFDALKVWEFLLERMEGVLKINASILRSVIKGKETDLRAMMQKSLALYEVFEGADKEAMLSTFKRVANITKDAKAQEVQTQLFQTPQEQKLYDCMQEIKNQNFENIKDYIQALFSLKVPLEEFFENVMVNIEEETIRENRKALIYEIYQMFLEIGDIKEIAG